MGNAQESFSFNVNVNGWTGWLTLDLKDTTCSGIMRIDFNPSGEKVDQQVSLTNGKVNRQTEYVKVTFDRKIDTRVQTYTGFLSSGEDHRIIAGNFTSSEEGTRPWFGVRVR